MPKIVIDDYVADGYHVANNTKNNRAQHEAANRPLLEQWFKVNQDKLSLVAEQLTKKLGEEKFKNMTLSNPEISWDEVKFSNKVSNKGYLTPKVTFNLTPKEDYKKASDSSEKVTLTIRNLYKEANSDTNVFATQGAYYTATPSDNATTIKKVNVYLNYTGPNIVLDADLPRVGEQENTSLNGTSNVTDDFNNKFNKLLIRYKAETSLFQTIINYVNKFDPKFKAAFVTSINGVAIASVQNGTQLRIGNLNDLLWNNKVFLQQVNGDSSAVYFAVNGVTSEGWLNTFLIRIPLTKFVRPLTEFQAQSPAAPTEEASGDQAQADPQATQMGTQAQS
ncbi:hemagglutinin [Mycoplasmopsis synoviae]|uniref:hemagglutinin n=1 Tax=Mycoplasmopsis synoviae TaxID=2109 RepID=UPI001CE20167|nr:hemagglutinin [Mycoplasmopsis synoviae]UBX97923.1 hemagglutinin [Mycoplasmopsis synoviae]